MIDDRGARADSLNQSPLAHHLEMSRCCGLVQPEFIGEFGYIERLLTKGIQHEDTVGIGKREAEISFELGNFLFEGWIYHVILIYIRINAYLHDHLTLMKGCTKVFSVILIYELCHI
jgi:hypothetical protein